MVYLLYILHTTKLAPDDLGNLRHNKTLGAGNQLIKS